MGLFETAQLRAQSIGRAAGDGIEACTEELDCKNSEALVFAVNGHIGERLHVPLRVAVTSATLKLKK
jgi:hypothetical protein